MHNVRHTVLVMMILLIGSSSTPLAAQDFSKGEVIEYKVGGAVPEKWEKGVFIRALVGGKQYLIHEKPSQFFPEGPQTAYAITDVRKPQAANNTDPKPNPVDPIIKTANPPGEKPVEAGKGLLTKEDILAYSKKLFGPGDPFQNKQRGELLDQIRDHIKKHGVNFTASATDEFSNKMDAQGTNSVHIWSAINANYGVAPKLEDYHGTFLLRVANRGSKSTTNEGTKITITTKDEQHETGELTISKDGSFVWKLFRNDPEAKWLRGKWREVKADEFHAWEAGPAIWLEKAKGGFDSMVRKCRIPDYSDWIDVGWGKGRTPVEYGRPRQHRLIIRQP